MMQSTLLNLTCQGHELDTSPNAIGPLQVSTALLHNFDALRNRLDEDGYVFLPGYLDRREVMAARQVMCEKIDALGFLDQNYPAIEAVAAVNRPRQIPNRARPELAHDNPPLMKLLYSGRMIEFYVKMFGVPVRHFDYTWCRSIPPGHGTPPHCDVVYMGRGSQRLLTAWTPMGDISFEDGGLMIMEKSNHLGRLGECYCRRDVDTFCTNRRDENGQPMRQDPNFGTLTKNPVRLRRTLGLRWLTNEYRAGDLLVFTIRTIHTSLDNQGHHIRFSTDSRYQPADEPADDRWINVDGHPPQLHGEAARRELIC